MLYYYFLFLLFEKAKRVNYDADESKTGRLSTRLSMFMGGQDTGTTTARSPAKQAFVKGTVVQTPMGLAATVKNARPSDGMVEVSSVEPPAVG